MSRLLERLGFDAQSEEVRLARQMTRGDRRLVDKLVELRRRRSLTQAQLAELMGVSQSAVAKFENGPRDPRLSTVRRYALALGVEVVHSVAGEDCSDTDDMLRRSGAVIREVEAFLSSSPHNAPRAWTPPSTGRGGSHWEGEVAPDTVNRRPRLYR